MFPDLFILINEVIVIKSPQTRVFQLISLITYVNVDSINPWNGFIQFRYVLSQDYTIW